MIIVPNIFFSSEMSICLLDMFKTLPPSQVVRTRLLGKYKIKPLVSLKEIFFWIELC